LINSRQQLQPGLQMLLREESGSPDSPSIVLQIQV
jgi:hypothetical protein